MMTGLAAFLFISSVAMMLISALLLGATRRVRRDTEINIDRWLEKRGVPDGWQLLPTKNIRTATPEVSEEHIVAIAKGCRLIGYYRTREHVDNVVAFTRVLFANKAVQEAFYRAALDAAPEYHGEE